MPSASWRSIVIVGSREVSGSWKTIAMWLPLSSDICLSVSLMRSTVRVRPSEATKVNSADPASTTSLRVRMPMTCLAVTDFPEPDSPTMATVSPRYTSRSTPRTAWTRPLAVLKETRRSRILRILLRSAAMGIT